MESIIIDGDNFSNIQTFYDEIDRVLTKDLDWDTGHNLDAFNDLLRGGFGVYDYEEPVNITWINFKRSQITLGQELSQKLADIILEHKHITFRISE